MESLSDQQISFLINKVKLTGVTYQPLAEDLVDHLACLIEIEMQQGISFESAYTKSWASMNPAQMVDLQLDTITLLTNKSKSMNKVWFSLAMGMLAIFSSLFFYILTPSSNQLEISEKKVPIDYESPMAKAIFVNDIDPPSRVPLNNQPKITSQFGMRLHPIFKKKKMHRGIDFKAPIGTLVYATGNGVVEKVVTRKGYGKMIVIKHDHTYQSLYAQLSEFNVKKGDLVKTGDLIGATGNSGLSTAPHLHYEVLQNGNAVDPQKYF